MTCPSEDDKHEQNTNFNISIGNRMGPVSTVVFYIIAIFVALFFLSFFYVDVDHSF